MNIIGWILLAVIGLDLILLAALGIVCVYCDWRDRHANVLAGSMPDETEKRGRRRR